MAVEKYATLSNGQNKPKAAGAAAPARTRAEIAALAGVHEAMISSAHTVRKSGTKDEIVAVENGTEAITTSPGRFVRAAVDGCDPAAGALRAGMIGIDTDQKPVSERETAARRCAVRLLAKIPTF